MRPVYEFLKGEQAAEDELMRVIQAELHKIALAHIQRDYTLPVTNLVNEAYLRFVCLQDNEWSERNHFLAAASHSIREILVDHARSRNAQKRHGQYVHVDAADASLSSAQTNVLELDIALKELAENAPRQARLVELRCFGGLSSEEAAAVLKVSPRTAANDWAFARAWLRAQLGSK
jgi:RNA polymerase sigma factor (TIGR02999 family)